MSIDVLQERIRKLKNPTVLSFPVVPEHLPFHLLEEEGGVTAAFGRFCRELMEKLKDAVPAVRLSFDAFALQGPEGLTQLGECLELAGRLGYYVLLDGPAMLNAQLAETTAKNLFAWEDSPWPCDGVVLEGFIGSDAVKPFLPFVRERGKDAFVLIRSSNRSAPEFQDLLTGTRVAHMALADQVSRLGEDSFGRCGYSRVAAVAAAGAASSVKNLRTRYSRLFLLLDGLELPGGNARNCSYAFDRLGHGAAVCVGSTIWDAWEDPLVTASGYLEAAEQAAQRVKKNFARYTTIL